MKLGLFVLFFSFTAVAVPTSVEVWFLSPPKTGNQTYLNIKPALYKLTAQADLRGFRKVGDQYFHPQFGLMDEDGNQGEIVEKLPAIETQYLSADETQLIRCDKDYHFDLFCGKAKKEQDKVLEKSGHEIWIDISSSFRTIDQGGEVCHRQAFVKAARKKCSKLDFYLYDTSKKYMGSSEDACIHYGMNDIHRTMQWIQNSTAKSLILITDISEFSTEFITFLNSIGAKYLGHLPQKPLYAKDMVSLSTKTCN